MTLSVDYAASTMDFAQALSPPLPSSCAGNRATSLYHAGVSRDIPRRFMDTTYLTTIVACELKAYGYPKSKRITISQM